MKSINRSLIILLPKAPFYRWANAVFSDLPDIDEEFDEFTSYMVHEDLILGDIEMALEDLWEKMFEAQLNEICLDEEMWPQNRTWKMFQEWFKVVPSSVIVDLVEDEPLMMEEL